MLESADGVRTFSPTDGGKLSTPLTPGVTPLPTVLELDVSSPSDSKVQSFLGYRPENFVEMSTDLVSQNF